MNKKRKKQRRCEEKSEISKVIIVSGFAGSGKSTLAESLAKYFGLKCIHASDLLRRLKNEDLKPEEIKATTAGKGWWESAEGIRYLEEREMNKEIDKKLDKLLLEIIDKGNVVLDSWTMPWLSKKGFKIWLEVSVEERAKRVAERDNLPYAEVLEKLKTRDKKTADLYKQIYGFEMGKDLSPFDLIIKANKSKEEVFDIAKTELEKYFNK